MLTYICELRKRSNERVSVNEKKKEFHRLQGEIDLIKGKIRSLKSELGPKLARYGNLYIELLNPQQEKSESEKIKEVVEKKIKAKGFSMKNVEIMVNGE